MARANFPQFREVRHVAIHREDGLCHDENAGLRVLPADAFQPALHGRVGEMGKGMDVLRGGPRAFLQAGMGQDVDDDVIMWAHQRL